LRVQIVSLLLGWSGFNLFEVIQKFFRFNTMYPGSLPDAFVSNSSSAKAFEAVFGKNTHGLWEVSKDIQDNTVFCNHLVILQS